MTSRDFDYARNETAILRAFKKAYASANPKLRKELEKLMRERANAGYRFDVLHLEYEIRT